MRVESIDFSISDNLDRLFSSLDAYKEKMKVMGADSLLLHGPFPGVNPSAYDSLVREASMKRFNQCYEAASVLGAKKIVFHSGMNPYVYYKEYWAEHVALFWQEFMKEKKGIQILLENLVLYSVQFKLSLRLLQSLFIYLVSNPVGIK